MKHTTKEQEVHHTGSNVASVVAGVVIGGLAGAGAALLFAPQSGRETRDQIQQKTLELRDRAAEGVEGAVSDVKAKTNKMTADVQHKVENMQHHGQEVIAEQLGNVAAAAQAGKEAIAPEPEKQGR